MSFAVAEEALTVAAEAQIKQAYNHLLRTDDYADPEEMRKVEEISPFFRYVNNYKKIHPRYMELSVFASYGIFAVISFMISLGDVRGDKVKYIAQNEVYACSHVLPPLVSKSADEQQIHDEAFMEENLIAFHGRGSPLSCCTGSFLSLGKFLSALNVTAVGGAAATEIYFLTTKKAELGGYIINATLGFLGMYLATITPSRGLNVLFTTIFILGFFFQQQPLFKSLWKDEGRLRKFWIATIVISHSATMYVAFGVLPRSFMVFSLAFIFATVPVLWVSFRSAPSSDLSTAAVFASMWLVTSVLSPLIASCLQVGMAANSTASINLLFFQLAITSFMAVSYKILRITCGNEGRNNRTMITAMCGLLTACNMLGTFQIFRVNITTSPLSFLSTLLMQIVFESFRDSYLWYGYSKWYNKIFENSNKELLWRSYCDTFHWNTLVFGGEFRANVVILSCVLAEWMIVFFSGGKSVRWLTSGSYSKYGKVCEMEDPGLENVPPGSCFLAKMDKSLGEKYEGLSDYDIFCHLIGYGVYMVVEAARLRVLLPFNEKTLATATTKYLKVYLGNDCILTDDQLRMSGTEFSEKCKALPVAHALKHFVVLTGIYGSLSATPHVVSPYI